MLLCYQPLPIPHRLFLFSPSYSIFLGQQPCFSASICLSNNVTIYCIIVLYSHFMLSHSPWHYLKIVKTLSEKFLPEGKWELQTMHHGYQEEAWRLKSHHASPVWAPSGLRLRHLDHVYWRSWCVVYLAMCAFGVDALSPSGQLWLVSITTLCVLRSTEFTTFSINKCPCSDQWIIVKPGILCIELYLQDWESLT